MADRLVTCNLLLTSRRDKPRPRAYASADEGPLRARPRRRPPPRPRRRSRWPSIASAIAGACWSSRPCSNGHGGSTNSASRCPGSPRTSSPTDSADSSASGSSTATPYQQRPPRMSYALTADGRDLASALRLLADWGGRREVGLRAAPPRRVRNAARGPLVLPHLRVAGRRDRCPARARPLHDDRRPPLGAGDARPGSPGVAHAVPAAQPARGCHPDPCRRSPRRPSSGTT